ncbi:MAG: aspartate aminotransferase family protein [Blastocatellia bacterium]|nr:aspartate aminotransferase family protein [Blastocatellia bacterium]
MNPQLQNDLEHLEQALTAACEQSVEFLKTLADRPVSPRPPVFEPDTLPAEGWGVRKTFDFFREKYLSGISGSAGPRYFGFVTGGTTPAALVGDWLTSTFDNNTADKDDSSAPYLERSAIGMLRDLFGLSDSHSGTFVSGATMANFVGLALGRQWVGKQLGVDVAQDGLAALGPVTVLSGAPHSCTFKALSMLGMGRSSLKLVPCLPEREAVDLHALETALQELDGRPCIVIGNAGTVNSVDFDDLEALARLKVDYSFWFHVDGAFGGFAACSDRFSHLTNGMDAADSIAIDGHKWLNVPYDCGMQFTRHQKLQTDIFQNRAAYLGFLTDEPEFFHLTPENSRRLRALPAWFSLLAYGQEGYREIVERNVDLARLLGEKIEASTTFRLLAPVRLNVVCFTATGSATAPRLQELLEELRRDGRVYLTPTVYQGTPGMRAALVNWRTSQHDIDITWQALQAAAATIIQS